MSAHPSEHLDALARGLPVAEGVAAHVEACGACSEEIALAREGLHALGALSVPPLPPGTVARALARRRRRSWPAALAAAIVVATLAGIVLLSRGGPAILVDDGTSLANGDATTAGPEGAMLRIDGLGKVAMRPGARLSRTDGPGRVTLVLHEGTILARIDAPARAFVVRTPHADAVDLGCAYELAVGPDGRGRLRVDTGSVALERGDRSVAVPGGHSCSILPGRGAGAPIRKGAPEGVRAAVERAEASGEPPLPAELASAGKPDAITLLHLMELLPVRHRGPVRARLHALVPQPLSTTDEREAMSAWREAIDAAR